MDNFKISLLQYNIAWENPEANKKKIVEMLAGSSAQRDLILLPEMFLTGFTMKAQENAVDMQSKDVEWLRELSVKHNCAAGGTMIIKDGNNYYNRFLIATPEGKMKFYDKNHLFSYGGENRYYTKGLGKIIVHYKNIRIFPLVCYDLRFPSISDGKGEFDLLIYVSNWPEKRIYAFNHLLIARAIENQAYVAAVNRIGEDATGTLHSGSSQVIDPMGKVIANAGSKETVLETEISQEYLKEVREKYPFIKDK